jgi:hypothetical protein
MLLLTKSKGHKSNAPYSGFPNHLQTKSNHHISICQSQIHYIKSRWETLYSYWQPQSDLRSIYEIMYELKWHTELWIFCKNFVVVVQICIILIW